MHRRRFFELSSAAMVGVASGIQIGRHESQAQDDDDRPSIVVAANFIPPTLDPTESGSAYELMTSGQAETLTQIANDFSVEPWLAESIAQIDPTTWRIGLRQNAAFWDGSPVDAAAVVASLQWSLASFDGSDGFLDPATTITAVDERMVELVTPRPDTALANNLASFYFAIAKQTEDGTFQFTGPYVPDQLKPDESFVIKAFDNYWDGTPSFAQIDLKLIPDANTAILALQSSEAALLSSVPVDMVDIVASEFEVASIDSPRVHHVMFNHASPIMADVAVREAFSLAIDRNALNDLAASGQGAITTNPFPASAGFGAQISSEPDIEGAKTLLDEAGWIEGADGVRERDGQRLELLIGSYAGRPELTPIGIGIQDQLKELGFDIDVQEVPDIAEFQAGDDWEASMYSINTLPTGDPLYLLNAAYVTGGIYNYGHYSNPALDELAGRIRDESDATARATLVDEAIALLVEDAANAWVLSMPRTVAFDPGVIASVDVSPSDLYFIGSRIVPANRNS